MQLAQWYLTEGAADNATIWFERAIALTPECNQLRERAAEAWIRVGNRMRAFEQLSLSSRTGTPQTKLNALKLDFQQALIQPDPLPDVDGMRKKVRSLKNEMSSKRSQFSNEREFRGFFGELDVLQACLPAQGLSLEQHVVSAEFTSNVAVIAQENRGVESVQRFAAEYLAVLGDRYNAELALQSLDQLYGEDSAKAAAARARVAAAIGRPHDASNFLISQIGVDDSETRQTMILAANMAMEASDVEYAYIAMSKIAPSQRTCHDLFSLVKLSNQLPENGDVLDLVDRSKSELVGQWMAELEQREKGACGFSKYLKADAMVSQLKGIRNNEIAPQDPRLVHAQNLVRELISLRPVWPKTILLASDLAFVEGNRKLGIRMLRDAIIAGESSPDFQRRIETHRLVANHPARSRTTLASSQQVISETPTQNKAICKFVAAFQAANLSCLPNRFNAGQPLVDVESY